MAVTAAPTTRMLTMVEALAELRMSRAAFYRLRARGNAPRCLKLPNGQIRIRRADLDAWFEGCEVLAC
ncbi:helix-turn-helix transcriptional regulator [Streptomyces anulatus]|uniref:helix-turn-helix transcriptional regulator n=1 Tax=Streptomyces anulatus TaxID=1892 RepID=UPI00364D53F7